MPSATKFDGWQTFLDDFALARAARLAREARESPALNPWEVLGLEHQESSHSRVLAWLLDCNGSHAQGGQFLRVLLERLTEKISLPIECADNAYSTEREQQNSSSRIDVAVWCAGTFLIHLEVKVRAKEGSRQIDRETSDLHALARHYRVPMDRVRGLFLTVEGTAPATGASAAFQPISWSCVADCVATFSAWVQQHFPENVRLVWVLEQYRQVLRSFVLKAFDGNDF